MKGKHAREKYSIIIASQTDARKSSKSLCLARHTLILIFSGILVFVFVSAGATAVSLLQISAYSSQLENLKAKLSEQSRVIESFKTAIKASKEGASGSAPSVPDLSAKAESGNKIAGGSMALAAASASVPVSPSVSAPGSASPSSPSVSFSPSVSAKFKPSGTPSPSDTAPRLIAGAQPSVALSAEKFSRVLIPMKDAVQMINSQFQSKIDAGIAQAKGDGEYDEVNIIYGGDLDGDSDTVNNWADVLSVFFAEKMKDGQKMLGVTQENFEALRELYFKMNPLSVISEKTVQSSPGADAEIERSVLTIHVSVDSKTYLEADEVRGFSKNQMNTLKKLMSRAYYTYFEGILGIDVYDGTPSEKVQQIIAGLPEGKGGDIVRAALIRLGSPYSKSKRGSGNYVDCSYFTWWAYNQAGISIPTSSTEQALYCYNNDCTVKLSELMPGDLIFWSKTGCKCGRWREIHHAGIYIGDGMIIDASSSKGRVVIRKLWGLDGGRWKVRMFGRPYEIQQASSN